MTNKILKTQDNTTYHTIKDICNSCFSENYSGYQKGTYKINEYYMAWFPQIAYAEDGVLKAGSETKGWINEIKDDGLCIVEYNKNEKHDEDETEFQIRRLVFAKNKGEDYKFLGVYKTVSYRDETVPHAKRIHQRIATEVDISILDIESLDDQEQAFMEEPTKIKDITDTEKLAIVKARIGQSDFRDKLVHKYDCKCALCGLGYKELLVASHIKAWSEAIGPERTDVENGLLLCSMHDALFDKYLISFDDNGKILIAPNIEKKDMQRLNITENKTIVMTDTMRKYMKYHRQKFEELHN